MGRRSLVELAWHERHPMLMIVAISVAIGIAAGGVVVILLRLT